VPPGAKSMTVSELNKIFEEAVKVQEIPLMIGCLDLLVNRSTTRKEKIEWLKCL